MMPYPSGKARRTDGDDGDDGNWVFYIALNMFHISLLADWDYVFPDDEREANPGFSKFLQRARAWGLAQAKASTVGQDSGVDGDSSARTDD